MRGLPSIDEAREVFPTAPIGVKRDVLAKVFYSESDSKSLTAHPTN